MDKIIDKRLPVSIVIPTRDEQKYLPRLLKSISEQKFLPKEVIVADSPQSADKTREIAHAAGAIVVDGGYPGVGRNRGVESSSSEYIYFLDADMILKDKSHLGSSLKIVKEEDLDVGFGLFENDKESNKFRTKLVMKWLNFMGKLSTRKKIDVYGTMANVIIKKKVFERVGGFNESMTHFEDIDFVKRLKGKKVKVGIIPIKVQTSGRRYGRIGRILIGCLIAGVVIGSLGTILFNERFRNKVLKVAGHLYGRLGG
jgi:glycosyltransferase involved in cell wall biosynthesis